MHCLSFFSLCLVLLFTCSAESSSADSVVTDRVLHYSRCNSTSTCRTPNNTACVVRDKGIKDPHCSCTKTKSAADCAKDETKAKAHEETEEEAADEEEEEEEMDICDPNPCLNGICIVDGKHEDSFRCYCIPGKTSSSLIGLMHRRRPGAEFGGGTEKKFADRDF